MKTTDRLPGETLPKARSLQPQILDDKILRDKARDFRKERIFQIVNNYQKSMQMAEMVQTINEINSFFETVSALMIKKAPQQEQLKKIKSLLIALDNLNSRQINAKKFRNQ